MTAEWIEPTEDERERLYILIEELNESSQVLKAAEHIALKVLRFGYEETYPKERKTNRTRLEEELGDVAAMIDSMIYAGDVSGAAIFGACQQKLKKLKRYTRGDWGWRGNEQRHDPAGEWGGGRTR